MERRKRKTQGKSVAVVVAVVPAKGRKVWFNLVEYICLRNPFLKGQKDFQAEILFSFSVRGSVITTAITSFCRLKF